MADIADMAGVTKSTVSRYFNGGYVKESTRERIQEITREYNYEPNAFARLKARESNVIGVVVPTLNSKVTSRVVTSIGRYLRGQGYETLIKDSDHSPELELKNMQRLMTLNVDGILVSAITITPELREAIESCPVPGVVLAGPWAPTWGGPDQGGWAIWEWRSPTWRWESAGGRGFWTDCGSRAIRRWSRFRGITATRAASAWPRRSWRMGRWTP